jgi:hypothetical protein
MNARQIICTPWVAKSQMKYSTQIPLTKQSLDSFHYEIPAYYLLVLLKIIETTGHYGANLSSVVAEERLTFVCISSNNA